MAETTNPLQPVESNFDDVKNTEAHVEEVAIARLTEDDLLLLSAESLRFKSWTSFRLFLMMFVQGCGQAGYGIDWAVISGINAYPAWHHYFGFPSAGATFGTINALMTIGSFCGAPFMSFADIIGRRGINFVGNAIVIAAALLQGLSTNLSML